MDMITEKLVRIAILGFSALSVAMTFLYSMKAKEPEKTHFGDITKRKQEKQFPAIFSQILQALDIEKVSYQAIPEEKPAFGPGK